MKKVRAFYQTKQWKRARRDKINNTIDGLCERCKAKDLTSVGTVVHHIVELNINNVADNNISCGLDNLELLCRECHERHHNRSGSDIDSAYTFDENGMIAPLFND